jgi:hypothetical protein
MQPNNSAIIADNSKIDVQRAAFVNLSNEQICSYFDQIKVISRLLSHV